MPNLNAALACAQLENLGDFLLKKRKLVAKYKAFFEQKDIKFRTELENTKANYWLVCGTRKQTATRLVLKNN